MYWGAGVVLYLKCKALSSFCYCLAAVAGRHQRSVLQWLDTQSRMYFVCVKVLLHSHSQQQGPYCVYGMLVQDGDISTSGESLHAYLSAFA